MMEPDLPHFLGMFFILTVASGLFGHIPGALAADYRAWKDRRKR